MQLHLELDCYRSAQKHCSKLGFPLDFAKPERPGTKMRSKPSDLKKPWPLPEPPEFPIQSEEPPPDKDDEPLPKQSCFDKICSLCCCSPCCGGKEASAKSTAEDDETESYSDVQEAQEDMVQIPPKRRKGILKLGTPVEQKLTPTKALSITVPETENNAPPLSSEPLASATPDANLSQPSTVNTDSGAKETAVVSFTATSTVVAIVSEPVTTIYRCDEISSVIDTCISQQTSETSKLTSDIQPCGEASSLPATSPKLGRHSPVLTNISEPDKVSKEHSGKETEVGKSVPTEPTTTSLPEPTTDTSPSQSTSKKTEQGSTGDQFIMKEVPSFSLIPSRSVPPRPHKSSRRYFTLATPATPQQKKYAGEKTAPLPGPNWIHKFL